MPHPLNLNRRTSFNVGHLANPAGFVRFMADYRPSTVLTNDDLKRANELYDATEGQTLVVNRLVNKYDGGYWKQGDPHYKSPVDYVDELIEAIPDKHIWKYVLNEPLAKGAVEIKMRNDWIIDAADELALRGHHGILGNMGPATWEMDEIEQGFYDDLLIAYGKYSSAGVHYGGWHYYTLGYLPFGTGLVPFDWLQKREMMQKNLWPKASDMPYTRTEAGKLPPYWHIGRTSWFDIRAEEIGADVHLKLITECWWDRLSDITRLPNNPYDQWSNKFGYGQYKMMRGPRTYAALWNWIWPQWTEAQAVYEQAIWAEETLPETYIGFNLFKLTNGDEWDRDFGFNMEPLTKLFDLLKTRRQPVETKPVESNDWVEGVVDLPLGSKSVYVRSKPGTDSAAAILGSLKPGMIVRYSPNSMTLNRFNNLFWVAVNNNAGLVGWVALLDDRPLSEQFTPVPIVTPPNPTPEPAPVKGIPGWEKVFDARQMKEINFNRLYATPEFDHGTDGHNLRKIVAIMEKLLSGELTP